MGSSIIQLYRELKKEILGGVFLLTLISCLSLVFIRFRRQILSDKQIFSLIDFISPSYNPFREFPEWASLTTWCFFSIVGYVIFPLFYIRIGKTQTASLGLEKIKSAHITLYLLLALIMLSLVFLFSLQPAFQKTYPFYRYTDGGRFWWQGFTWEFIYVLQFIALEFFFRGFLIHQSAPYLGRMSIYFSMIPYCMIHFSKPLPECLGSIFAGYILGWLSYKTKSIWGGVFLHVTVALSMDILSIIHQRG
jgi:membrane protease YdiL (CAAX protease family)